MTAINPDGEPTATETLPATTKTLKVALGRRSYDILIGEDLLAAAGRLCRPVIKGSRAIIVSDDNVAPIYLSRVEASLAGSALRVSSVVVPAGERSKDFGHLQELTGKLLEAAIDRATMLVALGGGVIGDLAGFAAAITMRGLDFVQMPTTLLAQVDSSVGGKTGINTAFGKNLIGAFHQPRLVLADLTTLATLPRRQLLSGYAEVVKYGLINDAAFFTWLEGNGGALLAGDISAQRHAVLASCAAKAAIVAEDERETGRRALLNLGHTFGHALEAETGYGEALLHGEAVAIGMVMAFDFSARLGLCPQADAERLRRHLTEAGLPTDLKDLKTPSWTAERLIGHMALDKKIDDGTPVFILAGGIGEAFICRDVDGDKLKRFLEDSI